ncbi:hypothetical protein Y1Q_0015071 [Alligator mississippiensis]|uniref:Uncharacterized protein n=1 Tax=Alligator mississippiensis TaxID=8496 RepID=A0A151P8M7_ALLMI|nr:hypothetical protein Y1Q_0015071 [Alligator mississippiensis]
MLFTIGKQHYGERNGTCFQQLTFVEKRWGTEGCHMFSRALHNYQFCTYKYRDVDSTRSAGHMAHPVYGAVAIQPSWRLITDGS